jgi:DNA modification methylase
MPDSFVDLIFTSPVYNVNIKYLSHDDCMPYDVYLNWLKDRFIECKRVLKPGGRLAINIDAMTNRQSDKEKEYVRPIYADLVNMMKSKEIDLNFRTEICWYKQNAVGKKTGWGSFCSSSNPVIRRNHEYILVWSKDQWKLEGDSEQSDMTFEEFNEYTFSTWFIQPETRKLGGHPVPFPCELAKRVIKLFTYRDNIVMDIFSGSGTTCYVAKQFNRKYIGIDIDKQYCEFANNRIKQFEDDIMSEEKYIIRSERLKKSKILDKEMENLL